MGVMTADFSSLFLKPAKINEKSGRFLALPAKILQIPGNKHLYRIIIFICARETLEFSLFKRKRFCNAYGKMFCDEIRISNIGK
jgi:hypothetical protein